YGKSGSSNAMRVPPSICAVNQSFRKGLPSTPDRAGRSAPHPSRKRPSRARVADARRWQSRCAAGISAAMAQHPLRPVEPGDFVYLIDGSGYIFRAYHALPPLTRRSDGLPVGAVHGFCAMLNKLLRETNAGEAPTHLA